MEGLMGAAKEAMGGGEAPPHDPAEAEAPGRVDSPRRQQTRRSLIFTQAAINAEADKAGAAGNSDLMAKLKAAATNKKIQGAFMDVKNNGVSAAMKYKDDGRALRRNQLQRATRHRRDVGPVNASARWRGTYWFISAQPR